MRRGKFLVIVPLVGAGMLSALQVQPASAQAPSYNIDWRTVAGSSQTNSPVPRWLRGQGPECFTSEDLVPKKKNALRIAPGLSERSEGLRLQRR
jgi:hypothetical protein